MRRTGQFGSAIGSVPNLTRVRSCASFIFVVLCCLASAGVHAGDRFRYKYISLENALPADLVFFIPVSITDNGRVYGTAFRCGADDCAAVVVVVDRGRGKVLHEGFASAANNRGMVGGDLDNQPALFDGNRVKRLPLPPGAVTGRVIRVTDSGIALVQTENSDGGIAGYFLYRRGRQIPLDFGQGQVLFLDLNNYGLIAGTQNDRAFRLHPPARKVVLSPLPTEPSAWGQAIDDQGAVLGYSFVSGGLERIGVWQGRRFRTYFTEGTPDFPTVSNQLLWNKHGLIVVTKTTDSNSYLIPRPGLRLNLTDLTQGLPVWTEILGVNSEGSLVGWGGSEPFNIEDVFVLQRVGGHDDRGWGAVASMPARRATAATEEAARRGAELARAWRERSLGALARLTKH